MTAAEGVTAAEAPLDIWLVTTGEPLPTDGPHVRLLRVGIFFEELLARGHRVRWWTSDFDHQHRVHRNPDAARSGLRGGVITMVPSPGYRGSISLRRLWDHRVTAKRFSRLARQAERPDVILCSYPPIELARATVAYGKKVGVPVILDIRDLWPDVIWDTVFSGVEGLPRDVALRPLRWQAAWAIRNASAVTGLTDDYVAWACSIAGRPRAPWDEPIPLTYPQQAPLDAAGAEAGRAFWAAQGVDLDAHQVVAFLGTIGRQFDFRPVLEAAAALRARMPDLRFVLCGTGEGLGALRTAASGLDSVVMPGWVEGAARTCLLRGARVGLAPYVDSENFRRNLPNKPVEYFAHGLPVVHSLGGVLEKVTAEAGAGARYGDAPGLVELLEDLLAHEERRTRMASAAGELFRARFRPDAVTDRLVALCREVRPQP